MSGQQRLGGASTSPAATRANSTPREYVNRFFPSGSILTESADPALESSDISDALRDVIALGFAFLFVSSIGVGFAFALFVLLFVDLR